MTRKEWLYILLACALLIASGIWVAQKYEWVDEVTPGPMTGEARRDINYAARRLIAQLGYDTRRIHDPAEITQQPLDATLVALAFFPETVAMRIEQPLLEWVKRGGHLMVVVPGVQQSSRFTSAFGLHRLGLYRGNSKQALSIVLEGRPLNVNMSNCDVFKLDYPPEWAATSPHYKPYQARDEQGMDAAAAVEQPAYVVARWPLGQGKVTAVCNDDFLANGVIGKNNNAELTARVLLDDRSGPVIFVPDAEFPSLWEWLCEKAWPALIGSAALLVLALWARMPRFGPIAGEAPLARPGLREHLRAMAHFHLKHKHHAHLLQAHRERVLRLAERHSGSSNMALAEVARLAGVDANALHMALHEVPGDRHRYLQFATLLAQVGDALNHAMYPTSTLSSPSRTRPS